MGHLDLPDGRNGVIQVSSLQRGDQFCLKPPFNPHSWHWVLSPTQPHPGGQRSQERMAGQVRGHLQESQAVLSQVVQGGQGAQALLPVPQAQQSQGLPVAHAQVSEFERPTACPFPHEGLQLTFCPLGPMTQISPGRPYGKESRRRNNQDPGICPTETGG